MKRKLSEAFGVAQALSRAYASAKGGNYSDQLVIKYFRKKKEMQASSMGQFFATKVRKT